jgi:alkanesulfonate monooxygenase
MANTTTPVSSSDLPIEVFATCPNSSGFAPADYRQQVANVARWSEQHGCRGMLVYTDNSLVDPWLVSQIIIEHTSALCPLVAVQPAYAHPYTVAKMAASFGFLYGRRIYLNMVAGGFANDLLALNDTTSHDRRYDRLTEYTTIVCRLLGGAAPVTFPGEFYTVDKLRMTPPLPAALLPGIFVSGSSAAGLACAAATGATAIRYPKPARSYDDEPIVDGIPSGIRVGIIARESSAEAWQTARQRFPEDRKGQLTRQLADKVSDSSWHKQLTAMADEHDPESPYWLVPFQNYKTMCPYLVGSYDEVGNELARYIGAGYHTFILDIPPAEDELRHTSQAFACASSYSLT